MKNIIGTPARGEDFYPRESEVRKVVKAIDDGSNIQLAAPRRVGKTSILMHLLDELQHESHFLYVDTEAIDNSNQFFKKLYIQVVKSNFISKSEKIIEQLKLAGNNFLKKIKGVNIGPGGLEINEDNDLDFYEELTNLISGLTLEEKIIVIMVDEFPYTINNIIASNPDNSREIIEFLQKNRSLRQNPELNKKLKFIYTGSIGLNSTVEAINATALINDILSVGINPLTDVQAKEMINLILQYEEKSITDDNLAFLIKRIEWLTPFYVKLIIKEIIDLIEVENKSIEESHINDAFSEIINYRNNNYFEHYYSRLQKFFKDQEFEFVIDILCLIASANTITKSELYNLATKHKLKKDYRGKLHTLIYDGYIHSSDGGETFRFNSPILKDWWKKYVNS